jgi:hypothetical protein
MSRRQVDSRHETRAEKSTRSLVTEISTPLPEQFSLSPMQVSVRLRDPLSVRLRDETDISVHLYSSPDT